MERIAHYPLLVFAVSFVILWLSARLGRYLLLRQHKPEKELREDFNIILAATLTLLGLIIGFSFSMAANRYDLRRNYEEAEANAIGTEYLRVELLPAADTNKLKALLHSYLDQRIAFYRAHSEAEAEQINTRTTALENDLWSAVRAPAIAQPNPVTALVVSGMNDVLNSQGYTQAGFWNRIPRGSWALMLTIAIGSNLLVGFGSRSVTAGTRLLPILPLLVSIAFMLIADIDSPRHGFVRVIPLNLMSLSESLPPDMAEHGPTNAP
jgi:hypothetical protein